MDSAVPAILEARSYYSTVDAFMNPGERPLLSRIGYTNSSNSNTSSSSSNSGRFHADGRSTANLRCVDQVKSSTCSSIQHTTGVSVLINQSCKTYSCMYQVYKDLKTVIVRLDHWYINTGFTPLPSYCKCSSTGDLDEGPRLHLFTKASCTPRYVIRSPVK